MKKQALSPPLDADWLAWPKKDGAAYRTRADRILRERTPKGSTGFLLRPPQWETAAPLAKPERLDGIGLCDGRYFTLCWAQTELGRWVNG
jgi:hypothetical protein